MTAEETGLRVQRSLDRLAGDGAREAGEDLVRTLMALYGDGLTRLVTALPPGSLATAVQDPVVAGLLVLHDLHPDPVRVRIGRALEAAGAGAVRLEPDGFDEKSGRLTLRRAERGCGCGGGPEDVEGAIACHAPEVSEIVWERAEPPAPLLQIGSRPPAATPAEAR
ncbi:thioredoxin [Streptomyces sp. NPDC000594]|uniref:thioredoxin n=1 Tax=Streptomyces sp. NPDC000594 TaxID=3154261 RepID=UPI00331FBDB7